MQLHADARRGNIEGIRQGLARGLSIDLFDREDGETPLMAALASMGSSHPVKADIGTIRFLLNQGANPNLGNSLTSPIRLAVGCADIATVELLESRGAQLNCISKSGYGVVVDAAYRIVRGKSQALEMLEYLVGRGLSADLATNFGETPLRVCWHHGEVTAVRRLLELGADRAQLQWSPAHWSVWQAWIRADAGMLMVSEETDCWGRTPFHLATALNSPGVMDALLSAGADADAPIRDHAGYESHALHLAAQCDATDSIRWLVGHGAPVDPSGFNAQTPLMQAVGAGRMAAIRVLFELGAAVEAKDEFAEGVFHHVRSVESFRALREFVTPAQLNRVDDCGEFPLATAACEGDPDWIREMLDAGAEPNFCGTGRTALHAAVQSDAREVAQLLLERGADPNAEDVDMDRPMYAAISREMVALLLEYGADPLAINCVGTPVWKSIRDPWVREFAQP